FLETILFWVIGLLTGLSAVGVAVTQNIVRAAIWLLFTLGGVAGLFFLLGADFVGATQLLISVGGILILVAFGVMLAAQGPFTSSKAGAGEWAVALVVGLLMYGLIGVSVFLTDWRFKTDTAPDPGETEVQRIAAGRPRTDVANDVGLALLGVE